METLKYKVIVNDQQYNRYCSILEELVFLKHKTIAIKEEIALLTLLIEKYDEQKTTLSLVDPISLLKSLMKEHRIKAVDLAKYLQVSEGLVSDILHYKKGLSKETIRLLAQKFALNQGAFNRDYQLKGVKIIEPTHGRIKRSNKKIANV